MSFQNIYYKRAVATAKPCYICLRQTTTVLSTAETVDFLYACDNHLTDPGFATLLPAAEKPQVSAEEIAKIKKEYEEKQAAKKEKEKAKAADAAKTDTKDDGGSKDKAAGTSTPKIPASPPVALPATPTHQRYALHRQIYQMRCDEHRRRRQTKQAREVAPKLPIAPRNQLS